MDTITTHEAKTHLSRYLADVEKGAQFIIARGTKPVASGQCYDRWGEAASEPIFPRTEVVRSLCD